MGSWRQGPFLPELFLLYISHRPLIPLPRAPAAKEPERPLPKSTVLKHLLRPSAAPGSSLFESNPIAANQAAATRAAYLRSRRRPIVAANGRPDPIVPSAALPSCEAILERQR